VLETGRDMARDYINEDELRGLLPSHSVDNSWARTKSRMLGARCWWG
jgi:hypothetical protein